MKSFILKTAVGIICALQFGFSFANGGLENNAENCAKVKAMSERYAEAVSSNLNVGLQDLRFRRAEFVSSYGCVWVISTPKGMVACPMPMILQSANKKESLFAAVLYNVNCVKY